ncbi:hypothetical protein PR202_ga03283 [Eleusine coracana subsp. coracana]|uniref:C2 domain-containing protein n=1 Tax=Eleusine coracana subsp. coracana TaxID=191504 RepID=A0AAV5BNM7_ELECO|nr:hypothetical protein PR202_ga03283 [Eleusine coracana subsp. coracana]
MAKAAEKLVVEVVAAHNLMPKDGQGSSSAFVEVEFEHQKRRTRSRPKDLNPVWNERLVFPVADPDDLPYRAIDVGVYNDRSSSSSSGAGSPHSRNFLGKVRVPASGVPGPGEEAVPQLFTLEKRSLFSHIRGEITLKIYRVNNNGSPSSGGDVVVKSKPPEKQQQAAAKVMIGTGPPEVIAAPVTGGHNNKKQQQQPVVSVPPPPPPPQQPAPAMMDMSMPPPQAMNPPVMMDPYPVPPVMMFSSSGVPGPVEFSLKETRPQLGGGRGATYDLVEQVEYLYVRVVKARGPAMSSGEAVVAEVKLGNYRGVTPPAAASSRRQWGGTRRSPSPRRASSRRSWRCTCVIISRSSSRCWAACGSTSARSPRRAPPDSTLAPQWYAMEDRRGQRGAAEVMVAVWFGTQADEAFAEAWHSKAAKVYVAPKLWYLRVGVIEAQDLTHLRVTTSSSHPWAWAWAWAWAWVVVIASRSCLFARRWGTRSSARARRPWCPRGRRPARSGTRTSCSWWPSHSRSSSYSQWKTVRRTLLGRLVVPVSAIQRRLDWKPVPSRWFELDRGNTTILQQRFVGRRVHLRLSLDGGYHVLDEATAYSSDLQPTAKQLWKPYVGVLELGVLGATGLLPMKPSSRDRHHTDAYCVAKYGHKWIRTRPVVDSTSPRWNEQYTWEVFDPCTVITVGVFDNCLLLLDKSSSSGSGMVRDNCIGKVRIRLSTLETDRVYTHAYPLLMLHPSSGVKKMGELHLAVRFCCGNAGNMFHAYARPLLPKMHYAEPLLVRQVESLRFQATNVVSASLARAEPPLGKEVVEFMLDHRAHLWSMRRSKANFSRLVSVLQAPIAVTRWFELVRSWNRPVHSCVAVFTFLVFVTSPELILPTAFLAMAFTGLWRYRVRPSHPPHMEMRLSHADAATADELDEEFDTFPSSRGEVVRFRYDRIRSIAGRVQTVVGDIATQGERMQALLSWRDPRATLLFSVACLVAAVIAYALPIKLLIGIWGLYAMRPPRFRSKMPSRFINFFRRLPSRADILL